MIYKSLFLVVIFALVLGVNKSNAQCDCIEEIGLAVEAVMATSGCDDLGEWEAPHSLEVHLAKLENWCDNGGVKPWKSKIPNIAQAMIEVIDNAYLGESHEETLADGTVITVDDEIPAPPCSWPALEALRSAVLCVPQ